MVFRPSGGGGKGLVIRGGNEGGLFLSAAFGGQNFP